MSGGDERERPPERSEGPLERTPPPAHVGPASEPPTTSAERAASTADEDGAGRDATPAVGVGGAPASWRRAVEGARVALARRGWADAAWSFLYGSDTDYGSDRPGEPIAAVNRRGRSGPVPPTVQGPFIKPPVWTWEVPLYFWLGGVAAGSSFVALACDLAGDRRSARIARVVALGTVAPAPVLLILDLGRPLRFLNMLRIVKPRSPMNMGAWALVAFSALDAAAIAADVLRRRRTASALGAAAAVVGGYLGSYTGVLLATTAVPLWARSRLLLGPVFVATGTVTGAAATRLALVARGLPVGHPTRHALGTLETGAMLAELTLSTVNGRRLGPDAAPLHHGRAGTLFRLAEAAAATGLALRFARTRWGPAAHHVASVLYLAAGLAFRYAWVDAGLASARDDRAVVRMARARGTAPGTGDAAAPTPGDRMASRLRVPRTVAPLAAARDRWAETARRVSLIVERALRRS